jgi:hypothetical protein
MTQALSAINWNLVAELFQSARVEIEEVETATCPLNHTQRPRLINMRLGRKQNTQLRNFLTVLLEKNSPLYRERICRRKAMMHWFLRGEDDYESRLSTGKSALDGVIIEGLAKNRVDEVFNEVERQFRMRLAITGTCHMC